MSPGLDIPKIREIEDHIRRIKQLFIAGEITVPQMRERLDVLENELRVAYAFPPILP